MCREPARIAIISSLATLLLGCASTPAVTSTAATPGKTAVVSASTPGPKTASSLPAPSTNLEEQIQAAIAVRQHGDAAQATRALAQLVLAAPDDPRVLGEYGKALVQQSRAEDAAAFLRRAVEIRPNDWTFYSALGVAYDQMDDRKNAKAAYDRALLLHPGDPSILNNYAVSRMLAKDYDGAQRLLMQAQAAGGDLPKIAANLQLLAQLRGIKTPAAAETNSAIMMPTAAAKAAEAGRAPVVVMQRVPSNTPPTSNPSTSRPAPQIAASSPVLPAKPGSPDHTASSAPRAITPNAGAKQSEPVTDRMANVVAAPAHASLPRTGLLHPAQTTVAPGHMSAAKHGRSIPASTGSASTGQKKSAVTAQKDKSLVLPELRTAD